MSLSFATRWTVAQGSYAHGTFQARILEWVPFPPPGSPPNPGMESASLASPALAVGSLSLVPPGKPQYHWISLLDKRFSFENCKLLVASENVTNALFAMLLDSRGCCWCVWTYVEHGWLSFDVDGPILILKKWWFLTWLFSKCLYFNSKNKFSFL